MAISIPHPKYRAESPDSISFRERLAELKRIYITPRPRAYQLTAIGWQPDPTYKQVNGREYTKEVKP